MKAYQLKITLKEIEPTVWRRAFIPAGMTFSRLAMVINDIMGWGILGPYAFTAEGGGSIQGYPDDYIELLDKDREYPEGSGDRTIIDSVLDKTRRLLYNCNIESSLETTLQVERICDDYQYQYAQIVDGEGDCPLADGEGVKAYMEMICAEPEQIEEGLYDLLMEQCQHFDIDVYNTFLKFAFEGTASVSPERPQFQLEEIPTLKDLLSDYRMDDLKRICKETGLRGYSSLKKRQMVDFVADALTEAMVMEDVLRFMSDEHLELFETLCERTLHVLDLSAKAVMNLEDLLYRGYVFQTTKGIFMVPPEIRECYLELTKKGFRKKQQWSRLVANYCQAAVNLYGIVEIDQLIQIFNDQNEEQLQPMVLQKTADAISRIEDNVLCQKPGYIYDENIEWDIFNIILAEQEGKPYYIPDKEAFLCYADHGYWEKSPAWEMVKKFFVEIMGENSYMAEHLCYQLYILIHIGADAQVLFEAMEDLGIKSLGGLHEADLNRLSDRIMAAWNTTRMITNRGFSPNEISALAAKKNKVPDNIIPFPGKH